MIERQTCVLERRSHTLLFLYEERQNARAKVIRAKSFFHKTYFSSLIELLFLAAEEEEEEEDKDHEREEDKEEEKRKEMTGIPLSPKTSSSRAREARRATTMEAFGGGGGEKKKKENGWESRQGKRIPGISAARSRVFDESVFVR